MKLIHIPPSGQPCRHKAFNTEIIYPDAEATQDYWGHLMCHPVYYKIQKGTRVPALFETGGKTPSVAKESLTGRCFISATDLDGTRTTSTTLEKPLPSLEGMTGYIVLTHGGSRLTDDWQQKTKTRLSRVNVTPTKTLFTPNHAPVDLALLAPGRVTRKKYLYGGTLTLHDTWLACVKGRDMEEWVGETIFDIEACARAPAQSMCVQGSACTYSDDLDPSHVSPAFQAEENVVCNFNCMTTQLVHCCHYISRSAVSDVGVYLPSSPSSFSFAVNPIPVVSKMPGAPTQSTADNMTAARQKVGSPAVLGAHPGSYFLRDHPDFNRMDMFNGIFSLYINGRFSGRRNCKRSSGQRIPQLSSSCW